MEQQILDDFESKLGLPPNILPGEVDEFRSYLDMNLEIIEKLNYQKCAAISYRLSQFALYIQRCLNKQKAYAKRLNYEIDKIACPIMNQYSGNWTSQKISAIQDNDVTKNYAEKLVNCEERIERLEDISKRITELSHSMKNIQFTKRENNA